MNGRLLFGAIGAGISTFLLVTVGVISILDVEFSALVGLPVGLMVGAAAAIGVFLTEGNLAPTVRSAISAYAGFGVAILVLWAVRYVNLAGLRASLSVSAMAGVGFLVAVVVFVGLSVGEPA